jgi:hypothetical protein
MEIGMARKGSKPPPASISGDAAPESILLQGKEEARARGIVALDSLIIMSRRQLI